MYFFSVVFTPPPATTAVFGSYTDKKENKIFLICKEIQMGAVAMTIGLLIWLNILRISS